MKNISLSGSFCPKRSRLIQILLTMKLILFLTFLIPVQALCSSAFSQTGKVTMPASAMTVGQVIQEIEKQTDYLFVYSKRNVDLNRQVAVDTENREISDVLSDVFAGTDVVYVVEGNNIVLTKRPVQVAQTASPALPAGVAQQEQVRISGQVTAVTGLPLPGVSIYVEGTTSGTVSDGNGNYSISIGKGTELTFSFMGYTAQKFRMEENRTLNVTLSEDYLALEEVVVVGYGVMKKSDLTGAVASVDGRSLNTRPVATAMEALSGKVAGMIVGAVDKPGDTPSIRIRGERSIKAGNSPLYVVDGIPRDGISDIPVSDIENIQVLKDAVSASIYGARAANGVILITTKAGSFNQERVTIEFDASVGVNAVKLPELMNGDDYITYRRARGKYENSNYGVNWATTNVTDAEIFDAQELASVSSGTYTDWRNLLYKKSTVSQEYNLSITTSAQNSTARFSVGYRDDEGYYKIGGSQRLTLGVRLDQKLTDFLKIGINARYTNQTIDSFTPGVMMSSGTVTYNSMTYLNPLLRAYDDNGNLIENVVNIYANPLLDYADGNTYLNQTKRSRLFSVFTVELKLYDGLTFNSNFGYEIHHDNKDVFYSSGTTRRYLVKESEGAYAEKSNSNYTNMTWDNILNYTKEFNKHSINATAVFSLSESKDKDFEASGMGLPDDALGVWNLDELLYNKNIGSEYEKQSWVSYIGRFQYGYDNRYLFNVSVRSDGASVLAPGNKWAAFPAASAAWILSNENFYRSQTLSLLKFRLSYGKVGNAAIDPYQTYASAQVKRSNFGETYVTGYILDGLKDKNLSWETTETFNFGIDWGLFQGRINGYVEAYRTYTNDLLFERAVPYLSGTKKILQNIGETSSIGLEANISSTNIHTKDFRWNTEINFATSKTKIEKLITKDDIADDKLFIGKDWNIYYDYILDGIWQVSELDEAKSFTTNPGYQKVRDISGAEGEPDGKITETYDRVILGKKNPTWTLYMRNQFSYKNLSLGVALDGRFGHMIQMDGNGWSSSLPMDILNDYWTPDNTSGKYPLMALSTTNKLGNLWRLRDASYIRMQEISLSYQFKLPYTRSVSLSFLASNPFYVWKKSTDCLDPATGTSDWTVWKSYALKLNITF